MIDKIMLSIAKTAIMDRLDGTNNLDKEVLLKKYPSLAKDGATFVTLNLNGNLRGCIGSLVAHRTLLDDLEHNAISAGFSDPRFNALSIEELSNLNLEVSVLSQATLLEYEDYEDLKNKVQPFVDGLILKHGVYQGTFLPQVWEQLPTPSIFLEHLSSKAGANPSIYKEKPTIYRYSVEKISESFDAVLPL